MKIHFFLAALIASTLIPFVAFADEATTTPDTTAPTITAPVEQTFAATAIPASSLLIAATATDDIDSAPVVTYAPQSFQLGTTTVTWTATDASGNSATTTSQVGVYLRIDASVDVPASCNVTDTDSVVHNYQAASSTSYLGICALSAAVASSSISSAQLSNQFPSIGLFVTALAGVAADPSSQYWALYQNGSFASLGLSQLPIVAGDTIVLQLHDFSDNNLGSEVTLHIVSLIATSTATTTDDSSPSGTPVSGGGGTGGITHYPLNISSALSYLASKQNGDGSFSSSLLTDWAALAFAASDPGASKTLLRNYLLSAKPALSSITDYERHAMALEALGIDPYSGTPMDYITPIVSAFDGTQIGDPNLDNDDIFAIFPLIRAGYGPSDTIIQKEAAFILSAQRPDGSWDGSADMTAAAAQAVGLLFGTPGIKSSTLGQSLGKAQAYLVSTQQADGGWGSVDSTSWVQTMINSTYEGDPTRAIPYTSSGGYVPGDAIARAQQSDGGVRPATDTADNRVWSTSYAVTAASGKSWLTVLQPFSRPPAQGITSSGGGVLENTATSTATSTQATASTTPPTATSTPEVVATVTPTVLGTSTTTIETASSTASSTKLTTPKPVKKKSIVKKSVLPPSVAPTTSVPITQTAAAANVGGGFLNKIFHSISSFFSWLF
ncbi:DUF4430 domain-containing protein [Candidatus Kaiserbacteria bacterium]|nr:DUF4430 domain-containing protein [Candidatus Kaiserbacteria bacterium]